MRKPQISIRLLMVIVLFLGVACAALVRPSALWASIVCAMTFGFLLYSLLMVWFRQGNQRRDWASAALFGWGHVCFLLKTGELQLPASLSLFAVADLWDRLHMPGPFVLDGMQELIPTYAFAQIVHCLFTLVVAALGTLVVRVFAPKAQDAQ